MTVSLNEEVRARLDAHLDAVEGALKAAGSSRERRRGVVDDLEAQILEMLGAKGEAPSVGDLEAVLARLDPPGAYGAGTAAIGGASAEIAGKSSVQRVENAVVPVAQVVKTRRFKMRHLVVIVFVLCGTVMVTMPAVLDYLGAHWGTSAHYLNSASPSGLTYGDINMLHRTGMWTLVAGVVAGVGAFFLDLLRK
jgi:hypothetical protein